MDRKLLRTHVVTLASVVALGVFCPGQADAEDQVIVWTPGSNELHTSLSFDYRLHRTSSLAIDRDAGLFKTFLNGQLVAENVIDNTDAARRDLVFDEEYRGAGGGVWIDGPVVRDRVWFFASFGGTTGQQDVSFVDPDDNQVTYSGNTAAVTYGAGVHFNAPYFDRDPSDDPSDARQTSFEFLVSVHGSHTLKTGGATREPPINVNGGVATADFADLGRDSLGFRAILGRSQGRFRVWGGFNYDKVSFEVEQRLEVDFSSTLPGVTSEFAGETELSKSLFSGIGGASFDLNDIFTAHLAASLGNDTRRVTAGITINLER